MKLIGPTLGLIMLFSATGSLTAAGMSSVGIMAVTSSGIADHPSPLDRVRTSVNPTGTDYGAALDQNLQRIERETMDSLYFWLFVICASATVALFVWVVLLEKQRARRLEITKIIVRQTWISMRVFATLWKESDLLLRGRSTSSSSENIALPSQPFPTPIPKYRVASLDSPTLGNDGLSKQVEEQQEELVQLHRMIKERDSRLAELSNATTPRKETPAERTMLRQLQALQSTADELRAENDVLAQENATLRNGGTVSNAMAALTKRFESLRVSRNKLQVDMTALRLELAEHVTPSHARENEVA